MPRAPARQLRRLVLALAVLAPGLLAACPRSKAPPPDLRTASSLTVVRTLYVDGGPPTGSGSAITTVDPKLITDVAEGLGPVPPLEVRCTEEMPPAWSFRFDFPTSGIARRVGGSRASVASTWVSTGEMPATRAVYRTSACFEGTVADPARLDRATHTMGFAR